MSASRRKSPDSSASRFSRPLLALAALLLAYPAFAGETITPPDEFNNPNTYDEAIIELIQNLSKGNAPAQDAARKLATFGKRAVPALSAVLTSALAKKKLDGVDVYYTVWALVKIKSPDAGRALVPLLKDDKMKAELRSMAVEAIGLEFSDEGVGALMALATADADAAVRRKAFGQLSMIPTRWGACEKLFVDALSDDDSDIRALAARQCYFARIYVSGIDKLIALSEKDPVPAIRSQAMLALARMRVKKAVPALVRSAVAEDADNLVHTSAFNALSMLAGTNLKDAKSVQTWWTRFGEKEYAKLEVTAPDATPSEKTPPATPGDGQKPESAK